MKISPVLIHLLKGILYQDQQPVVWEDLLNGEIQVRDYFKTIGLDLYLDKTSGFAYLKQMLGNEPEDLPRLIQRRPLSYPVSLLCVLLRKRLLEAEGQEGGFRVVLGQDQIMDMMRTFLPTGTNEAFADDKIESTISKVVEMGLLKALKALPPAYEVRPVIKALVDGAWAARFEEKISVYQDYGKNTAV
jgi:hypothetical protein